MNKKLVQKTQTIQDLSDFISTHIEDWQKFPLWLFSGPLGVGKTEFIRQVVANLKKDAHDVKSPSFTIINQYITDRYTIYHADLYRLETVDLNQLGAEEWIGLPLVLVLIEWAEKLESIPDVPHLHFDLEFDHTYRKITVTQCQLSCS